MLILYLLLVLMIAGAIVALTVKDLLSAVISFGIVGFGLVLTFLILQAPDLAIVQIVVEILTLVIMIYAILKSTRKDIIESFKIKRIYAYLGAVAFLIVFMVLIHKVFLNLPNFGSPVMRMAENYVNQGMEKTGAVNLVAAIILDFRGYDTLGEATVLFTSVIGIIAILRCKGRIEK